MRNIFPSHKREHDDRSDRFHYIFHDIFQNVFFELNIFKNKRSALIFLENPSSNYMFKINIETLEKSVKYVQS